MSIFIYPEVKTYLQKPRPQTLINQGDFETLYNNAKEFLQPIQVAQLMDMLKNSDIPGTTLKDIAPEYDHYLLNYITHVTEMPKDTINAMLNNNILHSYEHNFTLKELISAIEEITGNKPKKVKPSLEYIDSDLTIVIGTVSFEPYLLIKYKSKVTGYTEYVPIIELQEDQDIKIVYGLGVAFNLTDIQEMVDSIMENLRKYNN